MMKKRQSFIDKQRYKKINRLLKKVNQWSDDMRGLSDTDLQAKTGEFKERLHKGETLDDLLPEAFAAVREAAKRVLGLYLFDVQVMGGIVLHQGSVAEMKTGEGKTLTAVLPLYLNALTGKGAFLVTVNDYLAKRDAKDMGPIFHFMGLSVAVGVIDKDSEQEANAAVKRAIYASDIVYTTSSDLGFDYLGENLASSKEGKFLRPFNYAIVDEADAVLLDGAQTPLIVSGVPRVQSNLYHITDQFVRTLVRDDEYYFNEEKGDLYLKIKGIDYAERYFDIPNLFDNRYLELNRHIHLALKAHLLYKKNRDYIVKDNEVLLMDNATGRILEGTKMQAGQHQAIEAKENVKLTKENRAMASITYQSLFNMFPKLAGMTGTGKLVEDELIETYRMEVVVIPTNLPIQRIDYPDSVYITLPEKLYATLELVKKIHQKQQPILLVSATVEITEVYSNMLLQEGIPHNTLTASNASREAMIIEEAGQLGAVTVATTMAGRGTDIKLGPGVRELGGLAVIGTERMSNERFDWQIRGRSGRQGDPGMSIFFTSLEDQMVMKYSPKSIKRFFEKNVHRDRQNYGQALTKKKFQKVANRAQKLSEDSEYASRQSTIAFDASLKVQRQYIYNQRDSLIIDQQSVEEKIEPVFEQVIGDFIKQNPQLTENELRRYILESFTYRFTTFPKDFNVRDSQQVYDLLLGLYQQEITAKTQFLNGDLAEFYRLSVLRAIDSCWIEQVDNLQQLRNAITTQGIGQKDTLQEYHKEAFRTYQRFCKDIYKEITKNIMLSTLKLDKEGKLSIYFV